MAWAGALAGALYSQVLRGLGRKPRRSHLLLGWVLQPARSEGPRKKGLGVLCGRINPNKEGGGRIPAGDRPVSPGAEGVPLEVFKQRGLPGWDLSSLCR